MYSVIKKWAFGFENIFFLFKRAECFSDSIYIFNFALVRVTFKKLFNDPPNDEKLLSLRRC